MAIDEHTLIQKLAFAFFGDASAQSLRNLEKVLNENSHLFGKTHPNRPKRSQVAEWMKGRPIQKLGHYRYFKFVIDEQTSDDDVYRSLKPDQKKVFKQIGRLLAKRIAAFDSKEIGTQAANRVGGTRLLQVKLIYDSLADSLATARDDLVEERPNHPDSVVAIQKSVELIDMVQNHISRIDAVVVTSLGADQNDNDLDVRTTLELVADEFREWIIENKPEVVDAVMRLTPATAFLGMLGVAGANMAWATPIVLAICGGKSVVDIVKNMKN
ncbi:MAG: hypothetical protein HWE23_06475 [Rhodobacteraceae bacterium]|nr:hypothetical protein [Paracoccaceae bacterium]